MTPIARKQLVPGLFLLASLLVAQVAAAQAPAAQAKRGPATAEEKKKVVATVKLLETTPWTDEAKAGKAWLDTFLSEVPDLLVKYCPSLIGSPDEQAKLPKDLLLQHAYSAAAYLVEHSGTSPGATETLVAGLEGTLRSYAAQRAHGLAEQPPLERLAQVKANGMLAPYVRDIGRRCR